MSNFNKVVTNLQQSLSNAENDNLSQTLSAVRTAGGGGGGGTSYGGDGIYIEIVGNNTITLTTTAAEKLNRAIPTTVAELTDSGDYAQKTDLPDSITDFADTDAVIYSYLDPLTGDIQQQINGKQNKLQFDLNAKGEISAIGTLNNTTALAGANGITGDYYSASNPSGFITSSVNELEKFYSKTDTSSKTEISAAIKDFLPKPVGLSDGQYYAMTTSGWEIIQGAGDVSGITTVSHDATLTGNGNQQMLGVDITKIQTKLTDAEIQNIIDVTTLKTASSTWDNVSAKLNTTEFNTYTATTAPSTYQPLGNYLSSNALEGYATTALLDTISSKIEQDIPSIAGLATETDLQKVSAGVDYVSGALTGYQITGDYIVTGDILTATNNKLTGIKIANTDYTIPTTDLTNYYTKDQTSGATQLSTEFGKYLTTAQYNTDSATFALKSDLNGLVNSASVTTNDNYVMTNTGWKVLTLPGGGMTQVYHDATLTGDGNSNDNQLGVVWSALSGNTIYSAIKAASASAAKRLQDSTEGPIIQVGDVTALQNWASSNSSTWVGVTAKLGTAQYAEDSATFYTTSNPAGYLTKIVADTYYQPTGSYATSAGLTAGNQYAMTTNGWAVVSTPTIPDITANNGLSANGHTIGIDNTNLVADTQYAWTTTGWSDIALSAYLPLSGGTVSGQLTISGNSFNNNLHLKRGNDEGFIGLAGNGAITFKNNVNGSTSQIEFLTSANKTFDITVKDNSSTPQPVGKLYVMSAHSLADATATSANWANDGMLHIILES